MKRCPKCGYRDPPIWLNHQFQQHIEYTHIDSFRMTHPDLAKNLKKNGDLTEDEYCFYRWASNSPYVYRWLKEYGEKGYHLDYEKGHKKEDIFQTKLNCPQK